MYKDFFGFTELPFSIVPNSRYLYLSHRHKEAMEHLKAGLGDGGGFAMLTGEVGTGKTTVAKAMLFALDERTRAGFILNPTFSENELLEAICDEFSVEYPQHASLKQLTQAIYQYLMSQYAQGVQTLLVIDEAQHLGPDVLEQLRLLTNLETESRKLLKVLLIGQPELQQKLQMPQLRQLAQRITGRYHLLPLDSEETGSYIRFRLRLAGGDELLFSRKSTRLIAQYTHGIPRLINLVCDAALKMAYQRSEKPVSDAVAESACRQVMAFQSSVYQQNTQPVRRTSGFTPATALLSGLVLAAASYLWLPEPVEQLMARQLPLSVVEKTEPKEILAPEVKQLLLSGKELEGAMAALYEVWGYQPSVMDSFCTSSSRSLFSCQTEISDWNEVRQKNMPVVLTLNIGQQKVYAVLYRISGDNVELLVNGQRLQFAYSWLNRLWGGEFRYLREQMFDRTLKSGMSGDDVALLDKRLSVLLGEPVVETRTFNGELKRKVELFQRWQGMNVDGIAGRNTLQRLELLAQSHPVLT